MMDPTRYVRRLTVALDAMHCAEVDMEIASELAQLIGAELMGLFVEDIDLVRLAELPFAREVGRLSGQDRPLERESVESLFRRRVKHAQASLERAGQRRNVAVSHATARGKVVLQALEHREHGDVLLLRSTAAQRAPRARIAGGLRGPVMLWYETGPTAQASCELAVQLARHAGTGLVVTCVSAGVGGEALLHEQLKSSLRDASLPVSVRTLSDQRVDLLIEAAHAAHAAELVLTGEGPLVSAAALERLYAVGGLAVILVR